MDKYDFGNKLYEYRTQKGLTQKELGKLLGVTDKAVSKWETGESKPRLDKMAQITELFETSIDSMLGQEGSENGEQLKPYKTIFDSRLKKYSRYYKTSRIWTYISSIVYVILSCLLNANSVLQGSFAVRKINVFVVISILTSAAVIFTSVFKPRFSKCKNKDMNIFTAFILTMFFAYGAYLVISAVEIGKITGEYDWVTVGFIGTEALILAVIGSVSLLKKRYTVFACAVLILSVVNILEFSTLFWCVIIALTIQFICFIKKRNWLSLADKAEIEIQKSVKSQKGVNIFAAAVVIVTVLCIALSSFSPYIIYKICLNKYYPQDKRSTVIDYDYSAEFNGKFTEAAFAGAKLKIPEGYGKDNEYDESVYYKDDQKNFISVSYYSEDDNLLFSDEYDIDDLDPDEVEELKLFNAQGQVMDSLFQKYYGISIRTHYGMQYVNNCVDLEDIKFYESQKAVLLSFVLTSKSIENIGGVPMSVSAFDNGMYCGFVSGRQMTSGNIIWSADVWRSNDKGGGFYTIVYYSRNNSDITNNEIICQIINSLEF